MNNPDVGHANRFEGVGAYGGGMEEIVDLTAAGEALLETARGNDSGRAARSVLSTRVLKAVLVALRDGAELAEHAAPPAATLQCLVGRARLYAGELDWALTAGEFAVVPPVRHGVEALTDCVVLLTVAAESAPEPVELGLTRPGRAPTA